MHICMFFQEKTNKKKLGPSGLSFMGWGTLISLFSKVSYVLNKKVKTTPKNDVTANSKFKPINKKLKIANYQYITLKCFD